jgi:hypothetical protein
MSDIDDINTIDARINDDDDVTLVMNIDQAHALSDYLDTVDISDIARNPGTYGLSDDDATDFSDVLRRLAAALGTIYPA